MVLNAGHGAPEIRQVIGAKGESSGEAVKTEGLARANACGADHAPKFVAQRIAPLGIKAEALHRRVDRAPSRIAPVLGDKRGRRSARAVGASEILAEPRAAMVVDFVHQVEAQAISAIFVVQESAIIDQELANVLIPV